MLKKIFAPALAAGVIAGALITGLQMATTTPLILAAETYETAQAPTLQLMSAQPIAGEEGHSHGDGGERLAYTAMANILLGCGFALILTAGFALSGRKVDARCGLVWGAGGFLAVTLAPAAGLPPELPGMMAADLEGRQAWWIATVIASGAGLWLAAFARAGTWKWPLVGGGLVLIAAPHLIGAPHPDVMAVGLVPAELAARYAALSIAVGAVFWALIGGLSGVFWARFDADEASA